MMKPRINVLDIWVCVELVTLEQFNDEIFLPLCNESVIKRETILVVARFRFDPLRGHNTRFTKKCSIFLQQLHVLCDEC